MAAYESQQREWGTCRNYVKLCGELVDVGLVFRFHPITTGGRLSSSELSHSKSQFFEESENRSAQHKLQSAIKNQVEEYPTAKRPFAADEAHPWRNFSIQHNDKAKFTEMLSIHSKRKT